MLLLALALFAADTTRPSGPVYSGRQGQLDVHAPRVEAEVVIDGVLEEPIWGQAAEMRDFSQYFPSDGVPARDSTSVYVWYSPTAIYFGIRAYDAYGARATLADRDKTGGDDHVQLLLGTFNDGRRALTFDVNPFGVQADGVLAETGGTTANASNDREDPDLNPDFVWQSKGHLTSWGYEVEIRIPFKSIRFQSGAVQTWGINVVRTVQRLGYENSWVPAQKANPSFLGQSGRLVDLTDLHRGLVLDLNPVITETVTGAPSTTNPGTWHYDAGRPQLGGNVRWGISNNLTLNATIKPDFSQVETDQAQVSFDPRNALFYPEKRPFFLEGSELFVVPNNLIYTRRIVAPVEAVKLTGQALGSTIGFLSSVDDKASSPSGTDNPIFNILRMQRDVGSTSRLGLAYTDREVGSDFNRMLSLDTRIIFGGIYSLVAQAAGSATRTNGVLLKSPLWDVRLARVGRHLSTLYEMRAVGSDFQAQSGFINRNGVVRISADHRYSIFGKPGGFIDAFTPGLYADGTWTYDNFVHGQAWQDRKFHINTLTAFRGGWQFYANAFIERFGFDPVLYKNYYVAKPNAVGGVDTVAYTGKSLGNLDIQFRLVTPQFSSFSGDVSVVFGRDENFYEWSNSTFKIINASLVFRPTDQLRATFTYVGQTYLRWTDGTRVHQEHIPRLKLEYQIARPLFFRLVTQYIYEDTDALRDDSRTNLPILIRTGNTYAPSVAVRTRNLQTNALLSYVPSPGTVFYAGYGSTLTAPDAFTQRSLNRVADNFFLKLSYLFRL